MKTIKSDLQAAYDADAERRAAAAGKREHWKLDARQAFVDLLKKENKKTILEIGAGTGSDSKFFQNMGFDVLATDLSPEMAKTCALSGLNATCFDLYELERLGKKFDAIYSMNVLLHTPKKDLETVLTGISNSLEPKGVFFYGVYGGIDEEKTMVDKRKMDMPRFFSFLSDESLLAIARSKFEIIDFETIDFGSDIPGLHFQSLFLRKN